MTEQSGSPRDPFAGMTAEERKHAQERMILAMVYDIPSLDRWEQRERPDFALWVANIDSPFGVEVTQLFPSESHARLELLKGYMESLWEGQEHRHRDDTSVLKTARVSIRSAEGELKAEDVPVIMIERVTEEDRRQALLECIRTKSGRAYPLEEFRHVNLVILDWFRLPFDPDEYRSEQFFNLELKELLKSCPFREIYCILSRETGPSEDGEPDEAAYVFVGLREFFLASEYFMAGHAISQSAFAEHINGPKHLARLVGDHLTRVRTTGTLVTRGEATYVHLGGSAVGLSDQGSMTIHQFGELDDRLPASTETERLPSTIADEVDAFIDSNTFVWGFTQDVVHLPFMDKPRSRTLVVSEILGSDVAGEP